MLVAAREVETKARSRAEETVSSIQTEVAGAVAVVHADNELVSTVGAAEHDGSAAVLDEAANAVKAGQK